MVLRGRGVTILTNSFTKLHLFDGAGKEEAYVSVMSLHPSPEWLFGRLVPTIVEAGPEEKVRACVRACVWCGAGLQSVRYEYVL